MKLHRTHTRPDWELIPSDQRNPWQRLAASTGGLVTPGNIFSVLGIVGVIAGLQLMVNRQLALGALLLALGRSCDLIDGMLADRTGTKSPLGESIDATLDKIGTILILAAIGLSGLTPWWVVIAVLLPHIVISFITLAAFHRGIKLHPSQSGKLSMAVAWVGLITVVLAPATSWSGPLHLLALVLLGASFIMGAYAASQYAAKLVRPG